MAVTEPPGSGTAEQQKGSKCSLGALLVSWHQAHHVGCLSLGLISAAAGNGNMSEAVRRSFSCNCSPTM
ncbi:hypothetical protein ACLKA6_003358 [Drosophila palustris]